MHTLLSKTLAGLTRAYLKLVAATAFVEAEGLEYLEQDCVFGYWHGDSMPTMLLLQQNPQIGRRSTVIVTADSRGDVIESVITPLGATALRVHDGLAARHGLRDMARVCRTSGQSLATALDGPTGPYHKPKTLLPQLAEKYDRPLIIMQYSYKRVLHLNKRWDHYVIPLPFARISARVHPFSASLCMAASRDIETDPTVSCTI